MIICTDFGKGAASFFGRREGFDPRGAEPLPRELEPIAEAVFPLKPRTCFRLPAGGLPPRYGALLLVEHSQKSNLELLTEAHRKGVPIPDGLLCAAYAGRGFLGRHDRGWCCEPGNLHVVICLAPRITPALAGPSFSILAALAVLDTLRERSPRAEQEDRGRPGAPERPAPEPTDPLRGLGLKWVNDLMIGSRKIGGVLTRQTFQDPFITDVFLGLGVNVLVEPAIEPDPFVPAAGCLRRLLPGRTYSPGELLLEVLPRLERWYLRLLKEGCRPLVEAYRAWSFFLGRKVRIYQDGYGFPPGGLASRALIARGTAESVEDDLSLKIAGRAEPLHHGRMAFEEDCP